jgi:hypothetical protein
MLYSVFIASNAIYNIAQKACFTTPLQTEYYFPPTNVKETQGLSPLGHHQKHCSETEILHIPIGKVTHSLRSLFDYQLLQVFSQPC